MGLFELPDLKVEVAFDDDALEPSPTSWTDISAYVRSGNIHRGRSNELEQYAAGSLQLVLDNRTRRFDPFHTSGPYYGKLEARKQIRVTASKWGSTYSLFRGHVNGWPLQPDPTPDLTCTIQAYDGLAYLATVDLPVDRLSAQIEAAMNDRLSGDWQFFSWLPMGTPDRVLADKWFQFDKTIQNNFTFTTETPQTGSAPNQWLAGNSSVFDGTYGAIGSPLYPVYYTSSIDFAFKTSDIATTAGYLSPIFGSSSPAGLTIGIDDQGRLAFRQALVTGNSGFIANDDKWHWAHLVFTHTAWEIWVDGALLSSGSGTYTWYGLDTIAMRGGIASDNEYWKGELAHVVTGASEFNQALRSVFAFGADHAGTGSSFSPELLTDTTAAILTAAGWPTAWTNYTQGAKTASTYTCGGQKWSKTALAALQEVMASEDGRLYVDGAGVLQYQYRDHDYVNTYAQSSHATFSDSGAFATVYYNDIGEVTRNDEFLANRVVVNTSTGGAFTADDTTSQAAYGTRPKQIDSILRTAEESSNLATVQLERYATPQTRIKDWKVLAASNDPSSIFDVILWADFGYRVTVEVQPGRTGTRISQEVLIESVTHEFTPDSWLTTFSASPARNAWLLADTTYGLLEQTTILG